MIDDEAVELLGRFFPSVRQLTRVGDKHLESHSFVFSTSDDYNRQSYYVRFSPTAYREYKCAEQIAFLLADRNSSVLLPKHWLLCENLICRSYVAGSTLHDLQRYYIASTETIILLNNTRSLPYSVREQVLALIFSDPAPRREFFENVTRALSVWPSFQRWRMAIQRHLSAALPGEALRHPLAMMHAVQQSPVRKMIPFILDREQFADRFTRYLLDGALCADIDAFCRMISLQIDDVVQICRAMQLYDIHFDNLVLSPSGRLNLIDLECSGIGSSDRLLASPILFLEDLATFHASRGSSAPIWSEKGERQRQLPNSYDMPLTPLQGPSRIILCGTETYLHIIAVLRETLFIVVAMESFSEFELDALDDDIATFEPVWRDYQKLKRAARGMGFQPANVDGEIWREYVSYCLDEQATTNSNSKNPLILRVETLLGRLRSFDIKSNTLECELFMRTWEFLRLLPFEIVVGRRVSRNELDISIEKIRVSRIDTDLDKVVAQTLAQIFQFAVPYHLIDIEGMYRFPVGLRRRIERKISISERREMKRATVWLVSAIHRVRPKATASGSTLEAHP